jgi:hypothetical protein
LRIEGGTIDVESGFQIRFGAATSSGFGHGAGATSRVSELTIVSGRIVARSSWGAAIGSG